MNKKGLTFMSFAIAVICLAAVLIIVWPLVNRIIDGSEENVFATNCKDLITGIGKTYLNQNGNNVRVYSNVMPLTPRLKDAAENIQYVVNLNKDGYVESFKITDGKFKVEGSNSKGVKVDEIGKDYEIIRAKEEVTFALSSDGEFIEK